MSARLAFGCASPLTQARSAPRWRAASIPVMWRKVSVPKATSLGRTIRPRSSIQTTVGTFTML